MRLYVYVLQGKGLPVKDAYFVLQVGKLKSKTRVFRNNSNHVWNEEFVFRVHGNNDQQELVVSVFNHDDVDDFGSFFNGSGDLVGRVQIPVWSVAAEQNQTLPPTWFSLEKPMTGKFINMDCGKILLSLSLRRKSDRSSTNHIVYANSNVNEEYKESEGPCVSSYDMHSYKARRVKIAEGKKLMKTIVSRLERVFNKHEENSRTDDSSELTSASSDCEDCEHPSSCSFIEGLEIMSSRENEQEMPENLQGGILLDKVYVVPSWDLNMFLFAPNSQFKKDLEELQGTTDAEEGPWTWKSANMSHLSRTVSCTKAATKLVKAVKATEEQTYIKADGKQFAVLTNVSTPEVPYGNAFNIELLYKIMPGPEISSGEASSHLLISWGINFCKSTMMKCMIEGGARQGLKECFDQFADLLAQNFKMMDYMDSSNKDHMLATMEAAHQSEWQLASDYFWNLTAVSTIFMILYVVVHILFCEPSIVQGLEFNGLDLPDSFGQLITCAILVIQLERVCNMMKHFIQARLQRGSDHGVRAQGEGWVLTVALIEGTNLSSMDSTGLSDPFVVLTCNGKTRTSSVQLQTSDPQWNEILEFDAMDEPPSVLDVEVFDFDGPFDQATSLGHAEIIFLKHTSPELADMWIPLEGKLAQSSQSKLHLRIFIDNDKGVETVKEYLTKMEKEVGRKLSLRSPHRNSTFQNLFGLPPEEFLINDFTCHLKRKMPLQGRIFLSARILGFYANLFGHKTKFFFLWEDIEEIQVHPPSLSSVGSPFLVITLRKGRGLDARCWAKSQDEEGRLRYHFQSFISFSIASRTIMALWKTKTMIPEHKSQLAEEQPQDEEKWSIMLEDHGCFVSAEEVKMPKIFSTELPISVDSLMEMFDGGKMEHEIMEKSGRLSYAATAWESVKPGVFERHITYRFKYHISIFGGEVTCTQHKSPLGNDEGWIVNELMAIQDVPFADHFHGNLRYQIEKSSLAYCSCKCDVYFGITWLKSTKFQQRITRNMSDKFTQIMKEVFELIKREKLLANPDQHPIRHEDATMLV
ncbi:hypothetical protein DKX38_022786 [Salix brachista]|uniref:C2 and GRAM domain-containing protein n=1 Tax=Salix brachista TaxID=2182728 RepID=A0A5N5KBR9_9ROSI|nr:hypothetical protein DKX38_022786 [Salix brachista]